MSGVDNWRQQLKAFLSWGWRHDPMATSEPTEQIELPLTPAHVVALRHHVRSQRQTYLGFMAAGVTVALLLSAIPVPGQAIPFWLSVSIGGGIAGIAFGADWFYWR